MTDQGYLKTEPDDDMFSSYLHTEALPSDPSLCTDSPSPDSTLSSNTSSPPAPPASDTKAGFFTPLGIDAIGSAAEGWVASYLPLAGAPSLPPTPFTSVYPADTISNGQWTTSGPLTSMMPLAPKPSRKRLSGADTPQHPIKTEADPSSLTDEQQSALTKRQQRLIKNRAAALMSRKRKRDHLHALEEERKQLLVENEQLKATVMSLEANIQRLSQENIDLRQRSPSTSSLERSSSPSTLSRKAGAAFMIFLFSFAIFSLPTTRTPHLLTVGGETTHEGRPLYPLLASSAAQESKAIVTLPEDSSRDLQTWILDTLDPYHRPNPATASHLYLYANDLLPIHAPSPPVLDVSRQTPTLSLLSPLDRTPRECPHDNQQDDPGWQEPYLQIDAHILDSYIVHRPYQWRCEIPQNRLNTSIVHVQPPDPPQRREATAKSRAAVYRARVLTQSS